MAQLITDAGAIPPDMIRLPGGETMPLDEFYREHGDDLRPYADAQVIVVTPGLKMPEEVVEAEKALVVAITAALVGYVTKSAKLATWVGGPAGAAFSGDAARWINHQIEHGRIVRIYTIRELFFPLDKQRVPQSDLIAGR